MSLSIEIPVAKRKIAEMRDNIAEMKRTYDVLCESAQSEAPGWQADSRKSFEVKMQGFRERCEGLRVRAERLFDAQGEYFKIVEDAEKDFNG